MEIKNIKPKLLEMEELVHIFQAYNLTDQMFEECPVYRLFAHIAALTIAFARGTKAA